MKCPKCVTTGNSSFCPITLLLGTDLLARLTHLTFNLAQAPAKYRYRGNWLKMAELEEIAEFSEEAESGFEDAAAEDAEDAEDLDPAEKEELDNEVDEAKESASKMQKVVNSLKEIDVVAVLKKFTIFVAEQAAVAVVFYGVNVALTKILQNTKKEAGGEASKDAKQKLAKTKALSALITVISTISQNLTDWLKAHQSDTITIDGDITIPLTDIFIKYTTKMQTVRFWFIIMVYFMIHCFKFYFRV